MAVAALKQDPIRTPRIIKISSKRQVTIPADIYEQAGYKEYALVSWTDDGLVLQPIDVKSEDATVRILRSLLAQDLDGEELIAEYVRIRDKIADFDAKVTEGLEDMAAGRVLDYDEFRVEIGRKHDI